MTVIVFRDGVMAADTAGWDYTGHVIKSFRRKIFRLKDGSLFAACGELEHSTVLMEQLNGNDIANYIITDDGFCAIVITKDGAILRFLKSMRSTKIEQPFVAIGANEPFVYGALYAGASAQFAVELAIKYTDSAGGDVQVEYL
ncbi:MAG: hypothetical protein KGL39_24165 [Patescibacteria group bacterium]|nr:hypothetical protein [Patescibacteria group bacterium]